jgi:hypothetical protein
VDPGPHVRDWVTASTRCASDGISWGASGRAFFEKGIHPMVSSYAFALSPTAAPFHLRVLFASAALAFFPLFAAAVSMASLVHPEHYQTERRVGTVRRLLGWSAPEHAWRIRAGTTPLGDLAVGEFVLFVSYLSCGLALLISPFFMLLLEDLGL